MLMRTVGFAALCFQKITRSRFLLGDCELKTNKTSAQIPWLGYENFRYCQCISYRIALGQKRSERIAILLSYSASSISYESFIV